MAGNYRIFWAVQGVFIGTRGAAIGAGSAPWNSKTLMNPVKGVQSVGVTTTFNLEQAFELGQIALYENIEEVPDIEVTIEKVLDGYPLIYHLSTPDASAAGLVGRSASRCDLRLGIYADTAEKAGGVAPISQIYCSGMYISSVSYTLPVDGNCTESCTLVGNHKTYAPTNGLAAHTYGFGALSSPEEPRAGTGVQRRENVDWTLSKLPQDLPEITGDSIDNNVAASPKVHVQSVSVSVDLGREAISELGRKVPYFRYVTFPIEVSCDIEVLSPSGDFVQALEEGDNLEDRKILFALDDGTTIDLGAKNKLSSVSYGGGDTGGGNVTCTFSYSTFNDFTVLNSGTDPAGLSS